MSQMKITGFEDLGKALVNLSRAVERKGDKRVQRAANIVRTNVIKVINSQPGNWRALSLKYAERKAAARGSNKILISGVRTASSNTPSINYRNSFDIEQTGKARFEVGSNHPQARALEFGFEPRNLPARPHLEPAIDESKTAIADEYKEFLREVFN
ncbi:MAG: HK97 gp10 family phage protein [Leptospiraceae bacterium]|nr:HK97 gp10 family phage protein [Leptospiraceae bacterium]